MSRPEYRIEYTFQNNGCECKGFYYTYNLKKQHMIEVIEKLEKRNRTIKKIELNMGQEWVKKDISLILA